MRRALIATMLLLALSFPVATPPDTSPGVTVVAVVLALGTVLGLWRRWATPLTILRWATVGAVVMMTYGIWEAVSAPGLGVPLAVRFGGYAAIVTVLAMFVLGARVGGWVSAGCQVLWLAIVWVTPATHVYVEPGGVVLYAARYSFVLLVLLWGVLHSNRLLQAERDELRAEATRSRSDRRERLEQEQRRARILAEAAHELRAPLATIEAGAQTLDQHAEELDASMRQRILDAINHAATRLDRRTVELLDAARDRIDVIPAHREEVDAAAVVDATLADLSVLTGGRPMEVDVQRPCPAVLDPDGLDHILTNLVHNAVKYAPDYTPISVRLWRAGTTTMLLVADRGGGVPDEVRGQLFTPWTRDPSHEGIEGSGVGLAVARTWARRHGGDIVLLDTEVGAAFQVTIPDADAPD